FSPETRSNGAAASAETTFCRATIAFIARLHFRAGALLPPPRRNGRRCTVHRRDRGFPVESLRIAAGPAPTSSGEKKHSHEFPSTDWAAHPRSTATPGRVAYGDWECW